MYFSSVVFAIIFLGLDRAGLNDYLPRFCSKCSYTDPCKDTAKTTEARNMYLSSVVLPSYSWDWTVLVRMTTSPGFAVNVAMFMLT